MCGCEHDDPTRTRGGTLAVLSPPRAASPSSPASSPSSPASTSSARSVATTTTTDLVFHTPGEPRAPRATHVRLTCADDEGAVEALLSARLRIVVQ
jgi:hypothetical protein